MADYREKLLQLNLLESGSQVKVVLAPPLDSFDALEPDRISVEPLKAAALTIKGSEKVGPNRSHSQ